jgi:hypothetical protein
MAEVVIIRILVIIRMAKVILVKSQMEMKNKVLETGGRL